MKAKETNFYQWLRLTDNERLSKFYNKNTQIIRNEIDKVGLRRGNLQAATNHAIDGIVTSASDADDLNLGGVCRYEGAVNRSVVAFGGAEISGAMRWRGVAGCIFA